MYSPKVKEELVKELYRLKQQNRKPMTNMVNEAVTEYLVGLRLKEVLPHKHGENNYGKTRLCKTSNNVSGEGSKSN